jgi:hypothetical protein
MDSPYADPINRDWFAQKWVTSSGANIETKFASVYMPTYHPRGIRINILHILACLSGGIHGWSSDLHKIIGRVAAALTTNSRVEKMMSTILSPNKSRSLEWLLDEYSDFADIDSDGDTHKQMWHFASISRDSCGLTRDFDSLKDCISPKNCIVDTIEDMTLRFLQNDLPNDERAYVLKYIIHLIGDIHQPLHVGVREDLGGNSLNVFIPGKEDASVNLHELWDWVLRVRGTDGLYWEVHADRLIRGMMDDYTESGEKVVDSFAKGFNMLNNELDHETIHAFASQLALETFHEVTCLTAYRHGTPSDLWILEKDPLSIKYMTSRLRIVEQQMVKAGVRLAKFLDTLARRWRRSASIPTERTVAKFPTLMKGNDIPFSNTFELLARHVEDVSIVDEDERNDDESRIGIAAIPYRPERAHMTTTPAPMRDGIDIRQVVAMRDKFSGRMIVLSSKEFLEKNDGVHGNLQVAFLYTNDQDETGSWSEEYTPIGIDGGAFSRQFTPEDLNAYLDIHECINIRPARLLRYEHVFGKDFFILRGSEVEKLYMDRFDDWLLFPVTKTYLVLIDRTNASEDRESRAFRFNAFQFINESGLAVEVLIDPKLVDEFPPVKIRHEIFDLARKLNRSAMNRIHDRYPKLYRELLDVLALARGANRAKYLKYIKAEPMRKDKPYIKSIAYIGKM